MSGLSRYRASNNRVFDDGRAPVVFICEAIGPENARRIADALNLVDELAEQKQAFGCGLPHWHKRAKELLR